MTELFTADALIALLTLMTFWGVTRCEFTNYDDPVFVTENQIGRAHV